MPNATANTRSQVLEDVAIDLPPGRDPQRLEHRQIARQPDGERGQHDVEPDGEGELRAGQQDRVCFGHANLARLPARRIMGTAAPSGSSRAEDRLRRAPA